MSEQITPGSGEMSLAGYAPPVWIASTFAPRWYADAIQEARVGVGRDARRREIVFAVCSAESYLVEWVRDSVLNREFDDLSKYFPAGKLEGILDRWKRVVKDLTADGRISKSQAFGGKVWQDFVELVEYRNGLVHGRSSRPATSGQPANLNPVPSMDLLDQLAPGWAAKVVQVLVNDLHSTVGTAPPAWRDPP